MRICDGWHGFELNQLANKLLCFIIFVAVVQAPIFQFYVLSEMMPVTKDACQERNCRERDYGQLGSAQSSLGIAVYVIK